MKLSERIAELRRLEAKASPGPLSVTPSETQLYIATISGPHNSISDDMLQWDADFYAALRNSILPLLDLVEKQRELLLECEPAIRVHCVGDARMTQDLANRICAALAAGEELV